MPRYSCDKNDPGYSAFAQATFNDLAVSVTLDGEVLEDVITADEEQGIVIQDAKDENGDYIIKDDEFVRVERKGNVKVFCVRNEPKGEAK